jgi:hypothetical protein
MITSGQKKESACRFHSINSVSFLNGENEVSAGIQSINGFQRGNLFAGVGLGLDYYIHRSVPLFADIRYEYGKGKNKFFAYADAGINLEWAEEFEEPIFFPWDGINNNGEFHNGVYNDFGLGYRVAMKKNSGLVLSLGHCFKTLKETVSYEDWRTREWVTDVYRYKFSRISLKVGWQF